MIPPSRELVLDLVGAVLNVAMYVVFIVGVVVIAAEVVTPYPSEIPSYPAPESIPARRCTCECEEVP